MPSLERALQELIENAAKHGSDPATVTITVSSVPNAVEIQIVDNGPGLASHEADVLKTGSETPLTHGSGLGLWLSHWIVTSHGGSIDATSTDDGTTMRVSVPRKATGNADEELTKLTQARDQYQAAFGEARDAMIIVNDDARIIDANERASQLYGMDEQALLGQPLSRFFPDDFDFEAFWRKSHEDGTDLDTMTLVGGDSVERTVEYSAANKIVPGQTLIVSRDVTERQQRTHQLQETSRQLESVLSTVDAAIWMRHPETGYVFMNQMHRDLFGIDSDEDVVGKQFEELLPEDIAAQFQANDQRAKESGESVEIEEEVSTENRSKVFQTRITPLYDDDGDFYATIGVASNITERVEQQQALQETSQKLDAVIRASPDPIIAVDTDGRIDLWNSAAESLFGYNREEVMGQQIQDFDLFPAGPDSDSRAASNGHWMARCSGISTWNVRARTVNGSISAFRRPRFGTKWVKSPGLWPLPKISPNRKNANGRHAN